MIYSSKSISYKKNKATNAQFKAKSIGYNYYKIIIILNSIPQDFLSFG